MPFCTGCLAELEDIEEGYVCEDCNRIYNLCSKCGVVAKFLFLYVVCKDRDDYDKNMELMDYRGKNVLLQNKTRGLMYADCGPYSDTVQLFWKCDTCDECFSSEAD
ncbi:hypothetical protein [Brazilian marseillevirus]|uniref:hypothetical protein n=1 Tax=Brazilian marseillevirus TaxID=1813599 RepID=UPI000782B169|nr:hypothetical protein A3303_gp472 [Brazilian marseillevirus]AMQ10980.1 hypothetical protein [Brazilian marseillevirus]